MSTTTPPRKARRTKQAPAEAPPTAGWTATSVGVNNRSHAGLHRAAKSLGISNAQYASAAIDYFVATGIDPTQASGIRDGLLTRQMLSQLSQLGLQRDDENTNRVVSILRKFEQQLYTYLQETEGKIFGYLEAVEHNILHHQVGVEEQVLVPLIELVLRGAIDSNMARKQSEHVRHKGEGATKEEIRQAHDTYDTQRDRKLVEEIRALLQRHRLPKPEVTTRPKLTAPPAYRSAAPAGAAPDAASGTNGETKDYY